MKHLLVDTGAWYSFMDKSDRDHRLVSTVLEEHFPFLLTSDFIVDETITLLRYRYGRHAAVMFGEQVYSGKLARLEFITKNDQQKAWRLFLKYNDHCFSFTDCTSFVMMEKLRLKTAVAIDNDFRTYGIHCLPLMK